MNQTERFYILGSEFHLGPDSKLHFSIVHTDLNGENFCIDIRDQGEANSATSVQDEEDYYNIGHYLEGYGDLDLNSYSTDNPIPDSDCQEGTKTLVPVEIHYCAQSMYRINKCCPLGKFIMQKTIEK